MYLDTTQSAIISQLERYTRSTAKLADNILLDDNLIAYNADIPNFYNLNSKRIPYNYKGGKYQWLMDQSHATIKTLSVAAKQEGQKYGRNINFGYSMSGWMDRSKIGGVHPDYLIRDGYIDILDVQLFTPDNNELRWSLEKIEKEVNQAPDIYRKLSELRICLTGRTKTDKPRILDAEQKEVQLRLVNNFIKHMKILGVNANVSLFDSASFITGNYN